LKILRKPGIATQKYNKIKISNTKYTEEKFNENKIEKIVKMLDPKRKERSH